MLMVVCYRMFTDFAEATGTVTEVLPRQPPPDPCGSPEMHRLPPVPAPNAYMLLLCKMGAGHTVLMSSCDAGSHTILQRRPESLQSLCHSICHQATCSSDMHTQASMPVMSTTQQADTLAVLKNQPSAYPLMLALRL